MRYLNTDLYYITPKDLTTFKEFEEDFKSDNYRHLNLFKKFGEIVVNSVVESYWNFLEKKPYEIDKFKRTLIILRSVSSSLIIFVIRYVYHSFNAVFTSKKSKAIALIYLFFNTFLIGAYFMGLVFMLSPHFYSNKQIADVNEEIRYSWMIPNMHDGSLISFGDGSFEKLTPADSKISHHYPYQGKYTVTLYTWNWFGLTAKKHLTIEIQNTPPKFSVSLPENAIEDEIIEIKIHRLQDSIVDLEKGIQFLYDFGDETQLKSKEMKVKHQ
ncbi:MAG: PKD domain-containing protein, partial [Candidatus Lokiarchaeota archaeon]